MGNLQKEDIKLCRNKVWDILEIDWKNVTLMVNGDVINLPGSVIIPFWHKFKIRQMIRSKHFRKRTSDLDDSRDTSSQSIVNYMDRDSEERSIMDGSKRNSVNSDWNDLIPIDVEAEYCKIHNIRKGPYNKSCASHIPSTSPVSNTIQVTSSSPADRHKTVKNIVLFPYTPKPNKWGSWWVKDSQLTYNRAVNSTSNEQEEEEVGQVYQPHSLYYTPEHPSKFYEEE